MKALGRRSGAAPADRIRRTRRLGATLMAGSLAIGTALATLTPAAAQEAASAPEDAEPVEVEKAAFYEHPYFDALPNTVVAEFPPGVFCLVAPSAPVCQPNPVSDGVEGGLTAIEEGEPDSPESPVPPDTLPASILGGEKRYESAVKFTLPPVGEDETVGSFSLVLTETQPTYHSSSPMFRRAVLAALTCARGCQQEEFQKALAEQPAESAVLDVEVCPLTEPFEEGRSQSTEDLPAVDCLYGGTAQRLDGGDGQWVVDLTFAAQAWSSGDLANHGILIRPSGAPNLAYGDPDPTTSAQVTFSQEILAAITTEPAAGDSGFGFDQGGDAGNGGGDTGGDFGSSGGFSADDGGFSSAPSGGSDGGFSSSDPFSSPAEVAGDGGEAAPEVAAGDDAGVGGGGAGDVPLAGPDTEPASAGSTWWLWLLVPMFAAGTWMTAQSLAAEPVVTSGALSRSGAMSRLIARNNGGASGAPMTQV